ncbi:hypothetical protein JCM8097_009124 [Rhodosporidiobolus ruineniae]
MLFSRSKDVECWYCCSKLRLLPPAPTNKGKERAVEGPVGVGTRDGFWCSVCGQITRRDQNGQVVPDESAFFDSSLNDDSFSKRASTSRHHLPPTFPTPSTTPFCRQCLANQSLQLHLLASYPSSSLSTASASSSSDDDQEDSLPADESEAYPPLEEYRASLDARYPLVCPSCAPAVESTIRERDYKVKAQALGWRLRESQRQREREERMGERARRRAGRSWVVQAVVWRVRGGFWMGTHAATLAWSCCAFVSPTSDSALSSPVASLSHLAVPLALVSFLWAFWDPTWDRLRTERARGKVVNVKGRPAYLVLQMLTYLLRLITAVLVRFDLVPSFFSRRLLPSLLLFFSLLALLAPLFPLPRLHHPPPIRLAPSSSTSSPLRSPAAAADPLEPLAHLSLSRKGSLLAMRSAAGSPTGSSRGGTPLSTLRRSVGTGGAGGGGRASGLGGIRPRIPSFSLTSIPWGRDLAGGPGEGEAMDFEASVAGEEGEGGEEVEMDEDSRVDSAAAGEASMDWAPLPPLSPPTHSAASQPFSFPSTSAAVTAAPHVSFARQRFIPPDLRQPTGLEGMFANVGLRERAGETEQERRVEEERREREEGGRRGWLSLAGLGWRS